MSDFLNKAAEFLDKVGKGMGEAVKNVAPKGGSVTLTADKLRELKWMSPRQLRAVYGGKTKVHIDDDPAAYRELKWLNESQLKAIFGEESDDIL